MASFVPEVAVSLVLAYLDTDQETAEYVALAIVLLVTLFVAVAVQKLLLSNAGTGTGKVGKKLLLLGHCNSGKTKFLYRLRAGSYPETVTSIEPLETSFDLSGKTIPVVDFPGHARARGALAAHLRNARAIIFVIDSTDTKRETIREVADYLYDIFTGCIKEGCEPRVLIACNKSDLDGAETPSRIKSLLEKDMNELKVTRHTLEVEGDDAGEIILGSQDQNFDLEIDAGCQVELCSASAKSDKLENVIEFIEEVYI
mmetsp:Transcript_10472/g.12011  ORF Transcript_10472/g.12011 Transcript_10472/m.12011 type:complete len:257 (-) Transcript_10472:1234-2004(-)